MGCGWNSVGSKIVDIYISETVRPEAMKLSSLALTILRYYFNSLEFLDQGQGHLYKGPSELSFWYHQSSVKLELGDSTLPTFSVVKF